MTRAGAIVAAAVVAAAVVAVASVVLGNGGAPAPAPARAITVTASVSPRPVFFGDLVTARADVTVDRKRVEADAVRVDAEFAPFAPTGPPRLTRRTSGDVESLTYRFRLSCLSEECLAAGGSKRLALPGARVHAPLQSGGTASVAVQWPDIEIARRIPEAELSAGAQPWRLQTDLSPVTYRTNPSRLANVLALVAALLAAGALALGVWELERFRALRRRRVEKRSVLASALDLVRQSARRGADDRRKALAYLARVLTRERVDGRLVGVAARLAWSRSDPAPGRVEALANEVERETEGR